MKTTKYPYRLPQARVDEATYEGIHKIAQAQEMNLADVIRAALKEYVQPSPIASIPIIGVLKEGRIILYKQNGDMPGMQVEPKCPQVRYMEFEAQVPPAAPSISKKA